MNIWCVSYSDNHRFYEKVTKVASLHVLVFTVLGFFVFHVYEFVQRSLLQCVALPSANLNLPVIITIANSFLIIYYIIMLYSGKTSLDHLRPPTIIRILLYRNKL